MDVKIKVNIPENVKKKFLGIDNIKRNTRISLLATAAKGVEIIKERTENHKEISGQRFKPYSKSYEEESGKTDPDLQVTGAMLGSIQAKATKEKGTIYFSSATEAKKAIKNQATRPFFGFSKKEEEELRGVFERRIMRGMNER